MKVKFASVNVDDDDKTICHKLCRCGLPTFRHTFCQSARTFPKQCLSTQNWYNASIKTFSYVMKIWCHLIWSKQIRMQTSLQITLISCYSEIFEINIINCIHCTLLTRLKNFHLFFVFPIIMKVKLISYFESFICWKSDHPSEV